MEGLDAVVVGAGIGGLTAALALSDRGRRVTIVERRTAFSDVGAGLQLSPNASRILLELGLGPALKRLATEPPGVTIRSLRSAKTIGEVALGASMRDRFGAPYLVIRRADLQMVLLDAVRARGGIRLLVGRAASVADCEDAAEIVVEGASGAREILRTAVAVAADGIHSQARTVVADRAVGSAATGFVAWRALVPSAEVPEGSAGPRTGLWLGPGRHVVHYPVSGGSELNVVAVLKGRAGDDWAEHGDPAHLSAAFSDAAPALQALLRRPRTWLVRSLRDGSVARPMAVGRIALLGDAAHPILPYLAQGAALAIEDAAVLARSLAGHAEVSTALRAYAGARASRAAHIAEAARRNGRVYHAGPLVGVPRDAVMRRLGPDGMSRRYDWVYGWRPPA